MKKLRNPLLAGLLAFLSCSAAVSAAEAPPPMHWAGCGITAKAFMNELAAAYERYTGQKIELEGGGATKGIRRIADLDADMGGSCRPKLKGNMAESKARMSPLAWDALVVITHPSNPVDTITRDQLRGILAGEVNNWQELGGPDAPIKLFAREGKISGVGWTLRRLVLGDADRDFQADTFFKSTGPLEKAIEQDPLAIGVTGISSASKRNLKILKLDGKDPSYDNIRNGDYQLYRPLYLTYNPDHPRVKEIKAFIAFANSKPGRDIIRAQGVVPYLEGARLTLIQREQWEEARELAGAE